MWTTQTEIRYVGLTDTTEGKERIIIIVRQPGASGFYYRASEFFSQLARWAREVYEETQIAEEL